MHPGAGSSFPQDRNGLDGASIAAVLPQRDRAERTRDLFGSGMGDAAEAVIRAPSKSRQRLIRGCEVVGRRFRNRHLGPWIPWDGFRMTPGHLINRKAAGLAVHGVIRDEPENRMSDSDCWSRGLPSVRS